MQSFKENIIRNLHISSNKLDLDTCQTLKCKEVVIPGLVFSDTVIK